MNTNRIPDSEFIINDDGSAFHIHVKPEQLTDNIIVCGDPGRVTMIASYFDTRDWETSSREFHAIGGTYHGKPIFYSIGNFIFDQHKPLNSEACMVRLRVSRDSLEV